MELTYTGKSKKQARKRRLKAELKFKVMNFFAIISTILCIATTAAIVIYFDNELISMAAMFGSSIFLVLAVLFFSLRFALSGTYITSLLDEKTSIENYQLIRSYHIHFDENMDSDTMVSYIPLNEYTVANVNKRTGKIEIIADTRTAALSKNGFLVGEWNCVKGLKSIFYDYYTPSLLAELPKYDVKINYLDK